MTRPRPANTRCGSPGGGFLGHLQPPAVPEESSFRNQHTLPQKNTCIQAQFYIKFFLLIVTFLGCFGACTLKKAAVLFISHLGIVSALLYQQRLRAMFALLLSAVRRTGSGL